MPEPLISVIIPHLNQEQDLVRCLQSLRRQEKWYAHIEIIVVDNGSDRLPTDVVSEFSNVILIKEDTPGPGPARTSGAKQAASQILAFIDADCIAHENWLDAIYPHLREDGPSQIIGGDVQIARTSADRMTVLEAYESVYAYRQEQYIKKMGFSGTGNLSVRQSDFLHIGPFGGIDIAEDRDWGQRATGMGYTITYVREMIVYHPARTTFSELYQKWDRHIGHDYEQYAIGIAGKFRWLAYSGAILASPFGELWKIARSNRISGFSERAGAFYGLVRIRLYRFVRMLAVLLTNNPTALSGTWNRVISEDRDRL